jgi:hypothetical protein
VILRLPFLAHRQYLHGTTLFDALVENLTPQGSLTFKISHMIFTDRVSVTPLESQLKPVAATLTWRGRDGIDAGVGVISERSSDRIERQPYDEALITDLAHSGGNPPRATLEDRSSFSFIASLIPLNKLLLRNVTAISGHTQWLFTRLDLTKLPQNFVPLTVEFDGGVSGGRVTRSRVLVSDEEIGVLYFSMKKGST